MEITATSIIELHPLLVRKGNAGIFYVTKWGGKTQIATREAGILAINALKSKQTIGEIERALAPASAPVSIQPLLNALLSANLIRRIDGIVVSRADFHLSTLLKSLCGIYLVPAVLNVLKRLPVRAHRYGLYAMTFINSYQSLQQRAKIAEKNIHATQVRVPKHFTIRYQHHLSQNIADTDAVFSSKPLEAKKWLDQVVAWEGYDHIVNAQSLGKGIILAGFHLSATRLVAPLLLTRGMNVYLTVTPSPSINLTESILWHKEFCANTANADRFHQIPQVNLSAVKELLGALSRNDVVLTFPDMHTINTNSDEATKKRCTFFGINPSHFKIPTTSLRVAGVDAQMNEWVGWLSARSKAPVIPVVLVRQKQGRFVIRFSEPITCPSAQNPDDSAEIINREVFRILDEYIRAYPTQWFGWHRFHLQRVIK